MRNQLNVVAHIAVADRYVTPVSPLERLSPTSRRCSGWRRRLAETAAAHVATATIQTMKSRLRFTTSK
jgi:hypothetical protein